MQDYLSKSPSNWGRVTFSVGIGGIAVIHVINDKLEPMIVARLRL